MGTFFKEIQNPYYFLSDPMYLLSFAIINCNKTVIYIKIKN
jgi:hypothetical protein